MLAGLLRRGQAEHIDGRAESRGADDERALESQRGALRFGECENADAPSDNGLQDHAQVSKTVTRHLGVSRVRIPPPPLSIGKILQKRPRWHSRRAEGRAYPPRFKLEITAKSTAVA